MFGGVLFIKDGIRVTSNKNKENSTNGEDYDNKVDNIDDQDCDDNNVDDNDDQLSDNNGW